MQIKSNEFFKQLPIAARNYRATDTTPYRHASKVRKNLWTSGAPLYGWFLSEIPQDRHASRGCSPTYLGMIFILLYNWPHLLPYSSILVFSLIFFYSIRPFQMMQSSSTKKLNATLDYICYSVVLQPLVHDIGPIIDIGLEEHQAQVQEDMVQTGADRELHQIPG